MSGNTPPPPDDHRWQHEATAPEDGIAGWVLLENRKVEPANRRRVFRGGHDTRWAWVSLDGFTLGWIVHIVSWMPREVPDKN